MMTWRWPGTLEQYRSNLSRSSGKFAMGLGTVNLVRLLPSVHQSLEGSLLLILLVCTIALHRPSKFPHLPDRSRSDEPWPLSHANLPKLAETRKGYAFEFIRALIVPKQDDVWRRRREKDKANLLDCCTWQPYFVISFLSGLSDTLSSLQRFDSHVYLLLGTGLSEWNAACRHLVWSVLTYLWEYGNRSSVICLHQKRCLQGL